VPWTWRRTERSDLSRYPYGREATVSYPHPDLQIVNNTPYGVMITTSHTASSVTVALWSTKTMNAEQTGQTESSQGRCTRVTTQRTRTWLADGHAETDSVFAVYRPGEGVNC
jgi:vancomycin resistance protein YoaR